MSSSKSKPPKTKVKKMKSTFLASKEDKTVESPLSISKDSKVQPDYTKVKLAIIKVLDWLKEQKMPITPWHVSEFTRQTDMMAEANDPIVVYIVNFREID